MVQLGNGDIIELVGVLLAAPAAVAALVTMWVIARRRSRMTARHRLDTESTVTVRVGAVSTAAETRGDGDEIATRRATGWFQDHYRVLEGEIGAERDQWAEEMRDLPSYPQT